MKCMNLSMWMIVVLIGISGTAGNATQTPPPLPAKQPAEKLAEIDNYLARTRKAIEEEYTNRIKALRERTQRDIADFEAAQKAQLAQRAVDRSWFIQNLGYVPTQGYTQVGDNRWLPDEQLTETNATIAQKRTSLLSDMERAVAKLESEKQYYLNTSRERLERRLKDNVLQPKPARPDGMVVGIVYSEKKQFALMNNRVVRPGDMIRDVKVVGIDRHDVTFEKNGNQWRQRVGSQPEPAWSETN